MHFAPGLQALCEALQHACARAAASTTASFTSTAGAVGLSAGKIVVQFKRTFISGTAAALRPSCGSLAPRRSAPHTWVLCCPRLQRTVSNPLAPASAALPAEQTGSASASSLGPAGTACSRVQALGAPPWCPRQHRASAGGERPRSPPSLAALTGTRVSAPTATSARGPGTKRSASTAWSACRSICSRSCSSHWRANSAVRQMGCYLGGAAPSTGFCRARVSLTGSATSLHASKSCHVQRVMPTES